MRTEKHTMYTISFITFITVQDYSYKNTSTYNTNIIF